MRLRQSVPKATWINEPLKEKETGQSNATTGESRKERERGTNEPRSWWLKCGRGKRRKKTKNDG
jgi:hypothetical protein